MKAAWEALERNEFRVAERAAREALARSPQDGEALYLLGSTLLFENRFQEALAPLSDAATRLTRRGIAYRLGHCYLALGDLSRAEAALRRETQAYPESANAHNTLGVALVNQGKNLEALAAFRAALDVDPAHAEAGNNAGNVLRALGRDEEALPYLQRAVAARPELADAHQNLGLVLHALRRYEEAAASFSRVLTLAPQTPYALGSLVWAKLLACDWHGLAPQIAALRAQVRENRVAAAPFTLLAASDSPTEQRDCAALHVRQSSGGAREPLWRGTRYSHGRLRLAYLSGDFHQHATSQCMARLFELHDRRAFQLIGVSYGPDDGSVLRKRVVRAFDQFVEVGAMSDEQAARALRDLEIDIAVDLKGHTAHSRMSILAYRPAPVQVTYLGNPGPVAAPYIDYVIADRVVIPPEHRRFYPEKVVYISESYYPNDATMAIAERAPSRRDLGLPQDAFVFCCFSNTVKLTPEMFDIWMRLLAQLPGSVLWLLDHDAAAKRNLQASARQRGIDPGRLVFAPRRSIAEHLARHRRADLFLDTLPYNAHTTACDALWAGLPVLTCLGSTFAGRVGASVLQAIGLPELVTTSLADYETLAMRLARDKDALAVLRGKLARNRTAQPLFDNARLCRAMEAAYREMLEDKLGKN